MNYIDKIQIFIVQIFKVITLSTLQLQLLQLLVLDIMSKGNKYSLLDKKQKEKYPQKEEWIEMENMSYVDPNKNQNETQVKYEKLQDQDPIAPNNINAKVQQPQQIPNQKKYPTYQQPNYPQNYNNRPPQNSQINKRPINQNAYNNPYEDPRNRSGMTTNSNVNSRMPRNNNPTSIQNSRLPQQNKSQMPQNNKPCIPPMTVNCQKCTFSQSVPGNCQVYICCMCNQMNECFPLYGIFVCGICQVNVVYPFGTSQFVKCTRCQTINRVPFQAKKSYKSSIKSQKQRPIQKIQKPSSSQMRRNQYEHEQQEYIKVSSQQKPFQKKQIINQPQIKPIQNKRQKKQEDVKIVQQKKKKNDLTNNIQKQERLLDEEETVRTFKLEEDIFNEAHHENLKQEEILFDEFDSKINLQNKNNAQKQNGQNQYPSFFD